MQESLIAASSMSLKRYLDERQSKPKILEPKQREISDEEITQYTDLEFDFELSGNWMIQTKKFQFSSIFFLYELY